MDAGGDSNTVSPEVVKVSEKVPLYGWSVRMDHKFAEKWNQNIIPRISQLPDLLPLFIRYFVWWIVTWVFRRRKPFIDLYMLDGKQIYGVPVGGIGSGSIGRGFKGEFCRFQMTPGSYTYNVVHADQFIVSVRDQKGVKSYQKVLSGAGNPKTLSAWDWTYKASDANYHGLYPRAWYTYNIPEENLILRCKQISPVIPHNYEDSCIPGAVFVWHIENNNPDTKTVSITFTFKNGTGSRNDKKSKCSSQSFESEGNQIKVHGVALEHLVEGIETTYGVGCIVKSGQVGTHLNQFNQKTGEDIWNKLTKTGRLDAESCSYEISKGEMGVAVNCSVVVQPHSSSEMVFSLVWHQPVIQFHDKSRSFRRRYCRFLSNDTEPLQDEKPTTIAVRNLTTYCLSRYKDWDKAIDEWQFPVLDDPKLPSWFKGALFNELYFVSDGGTLWLEYDKESLPSVVSDSENIRSQYGRFGYLEGHEYRMYNTYDVHFYASFALAMLWPKLQLSVQYDIADSVKFKDDTIRTHLFDGFRAPRKVADTVPHDVGDPFENPFSKINAYLMHDVSSWRDLNLKFVLLVFRDYKLTGDIAYLKDMLPICSLVMKRSMSWDIDGDGVIENSGSADQTYDTWIMTDTSAYCGGLWLAAVYAMTELLSIFAKEDKEKAAEAEYYREVLERGKKSFHQKLWTGQYYKFDSSGAVHSNSIMSDQLCGHWILCMSEVGSFPIFPKENVLKTLQTLYDKNVMSHCGGELGAVNGMMPDGKVDLFTLQSEEVWPGVVYSVASMMIAEGMIEEGFKTAEGLYRTIYEKIGMGFETPEALYHTKKYRSIGYMRPLSIWAMLQAWKTQKQKN